jgi:hypothetical protein
VPRRVLKMMDCLAPAKLLFPYVFVTIALICTGPSLTSVSSPRVASTFPKNEGNRCVFNAPFVNKHRNAVPEPRTSFLHQYKQEGLRGQTQVYNVAPAAAGWTNQYTDMALSNRIREQLVLAEQRRQEEALARVRRVVLCTYMCLCLSIVQVLRGRHPMSWKDGRNTVWQFVEGRVWDIGTQCVTILVIYSLLLT